MNYIAFFDQISQKDLALYGGKNAALGQMYQHLTNKGIRVPYGFALSTKAYWRHLEVNNLVEPIAQLLDTIDHTSVSSLSAVARNIRSYIAEASLPDDIEQEILVAFKRLQENYSGVAISVAVRSSATAEDLPEASFAGQQETFLNVSEVDHLLTVVRKCMASLFTDRAIVYRRNHGIDSMQVGLSVCVQKMVRADIGVSGVMFTLEPETGHKNFLAINASFGLGEPIVQGQVNPDEFLVAKAQLQQGYAPIVRRFLGSKEKRMTYRQSGFLDRLFPIHSGLGPRVVSLESVSEEERMAWSLSDAQIIALAQIGLTIEDYYSALYQRWTPMDIEWAIDGEDNEIYVVQARPETVHSQKIHTVSFSLDAFEVAPDEDKVIIRGARVGSGIVSGRACILNSIEDEATLQDGDVLVASMTDPDWLPLMERAAAIVTDQGGRACHAAIVSRELGIPAIVGTRDATTKIVAGEPITVDCSSGDQGVVYRGSFEIKTTEISLAQSVASPIPLQLNISDALRAINASFLPVEGVGLVRSEFIIASSIGVHPQACAHPEQINDAILREVISEKLLAQPEAWAETFVSMLAESIGVIAAAMYPRPVVVRATDLKSNEYASLLAGSIFETHEANPMLGLRGASRYLSEQYQDAFMLELAAIRRVRQQFGLHNCMLMIPFVRSVSEMEQVARSIEQAGLVRGKDGFALYMMVELPENVRNLESYLPYCDAFSIGSNDLTQLALGVDRDTVAVQHLYNENDPAVYQMIEEAIEKVHHANKRIGICGQGPADSPVLRDFLIRSQIDYISMTADAVLQFLAELPK